MAFVRVEQRNAHWTGAVRLHTVEGRDGPVFKAALTAISNTRRGSSDNRGEEATAIQWTLWGKLADNAAQYLGKGSHVNVVGRVQNNNYDQDGDTVYTMAFTAEEIDYLGTKTEGEAIRAKQGPAPDEVHRCRMRSPPPAPARRSLQGAARPRSRRPSKKKLTTSRSDHPGGTPRVPPLHAHLMKEPTCTQQERSQRASRETPWAERGAWLCLGSHQHLQGRLFGKRSASGRRR